MAPPAGYDPDDLTPQEQDHLASVAARQAEEGAYQHQQSTRPLTRPLTPSLTVALGLADSPAGLLAWIVEKYRAWSDHGGTPTARPGGWSG